MLDAIILSLTRTSPRTALGHLCCRQVSPYGVIFDDENVNWSADEDLSMLHLKCQQQYANDILQTRGLSSSMKCTRCSGSPHSCWCCDWLGAGNGDDFVDFNIFEGTFEGRRQERCAQVGA